jgi:sortase A
MRRAVAGVGRTFVTLGLLILLFVAYQLWGTGIFTARAQERLKKQFNAEVQKAEQQDGDNPVIGPTTTTGPTIPQSTTTTTPPKPFVKGKSHLPPPEVTPPEGQVVGHIQIKKINLSWYFVEGVQLSDLAKGPGHYPLTPLPGQFGNAAIAGHRTTHGAPFFRINELGPGDLINITMDNGLQYTYQVDSQYQVVVPTDLGVLYPRKPDDAELTLTACHPRYSASHRIVVHAVLVPNQSAPPQRPAPIPGGTVAGGGKAVQRSLADGLTGATRPLTPTVIWGLIWAAVALGWWWLFRRWRHPASWVAGVLPFLLTLFVFYYFLERALPPGI